VGDVRVIQRRQRLGFALETGDTFRISGEGRRQDFDGDVAIQLGIASLVDLL
jgi:hypothetical protein